MPDDISAFDPRSLYPRPPFPAEQQQPPPGQQADMRPRPDYGEASYVGSGKLEGRRALVTGGDSGIGRAVALAFAREGADVAISYLNEEEDAAETERVVREAGRKCLRLPGDIQDEAHCRQMVDRVVDAFGGVDLLVNNAGFQATHGRIEEITTAELDKVYRTNVYPLFWLTQAAAPRMPPGSSIINTSSIQAYDPSAHLVHYASTKAAIRAFTQAMAPQLGERGIRINAVAPGPVWTPLIPISFPPDKLKTFGAQTVFKRPGQPAEIAPVFVFLASPQASFVTGMIYGATGGEPTA